MKYFDPYIPQCSSNFSKEGKFRLVLCIVVIAIAAIVSSAVDDLGHVMPAKTIFHSNSLIYSGRAFAAEYEIACSDNTQEKRRQLVSCNGTGIFIHEWNKLRFLYDSNKNLEFIIDPSESRIYVHPLKEKGAYWLDEEHLLHGFPGLIGYKQLADATIDGRDCSVYGCEFDEKRYYDKETKLLVLQKGGLPHRRYSTRMLRYSDKALPANLFELPSGYSIIDCTR